MSARGEVVRWGILGTANIARGQFLPALAEAGRGEPVAVGGRDLERAKGYAAQHGVGRGVEGYQALLDDPDIDAVYLALPNALHPEWAVRTLEAGKALLCEKPLTTSVADNVSRARGCRQVRGADRGRRSSSRSRPSTRGCWS